MTGAQLSLDAWPEPREESNLVDCELCGCLHRKDVACPWPPKPEPGAAT